MALAAFQAALARLYVDRVAREAFARDGEAYADRYRLDATERARLQALGAAHAADYARTLARKRRNELARLLPRLSATLGDAFTGELERVLGAPGARRDATPVAQARRFARSLAASGSLTPGVRAAAREDARGLA